METAAPSPRWLQGAWWLGFVGSTAWIAVALAHRTSETPAWLGLLGLLQLVSGWLLWRRVRAAQATRVGGAVWAALALVGLLVIEQVVVEHALTPQPGTGRLLGELVRLVVFVGIAEELWFRGLWFAVAGSRRNLALFGSSVLFGLYHVPHGWTAVALTAGVGLVFGIARWRGAPVLALGVAHGMLDWCNGVLFPGVQWRIDVALLPIVYPLACIALGAAMLALSQRPAVIFRDGGRS